MADSSRDLRSHFSAHRTFAGVPHATLESLHDHDIAIVGAPVDWGTTYRAGTRWGPKAIRDSDYLSQDGSRPHITTGIDPMSVLSIVDVGDIELPPGYLADTLDQLRTTIRKIVATDTLPIVLGGDHSITYATAGAVADHYGHGTVGLVHFDAHTDTGDTQFGKLLGHGTPMRRLIESGAVPGDRFAQVGIRGYWPAPPVVDWMRGEGMRIFLMSDITAQGLHHVVDEAVGHVSERAEQVFLSIDIDVVDPSAAPGTGTPEPGGLTPRELLETTRRLCRDLPIAGCDLVEVSPPYDGPGQITSVLANRVVLEMLNGLAEREVLG